MDRPAGMEAGVVADARAADADPVAAAADDEVTSSRLPVVMIDVKAEIPADTKIAGRLRIVTEHDGTHRDLANRPTALDVPIGIELRGASSLAFAQKSFSIELRDDVGQDRELPVLGMPADADWGLVACWADKPCLRNALVYSVGRQLGRWSPRARFVEVVLNGRINGLYLLVELPRRGRYRIPIPRPAADRATGDITGGYVIRRELGGRTPPPIVPNVDWISTVRWPDGATRSVFSHHFPKVQELTAAQRDYIRGHFTSFETTMREAGWDDRQKGYRAFVDMPSWIDYALVSELSNNVDGYSKSVYFVKQPDAAGGKIAIFPLWDFNYAFGSVNFRDAERTDVWTYTMNQRWFGSCSGWFPVPPGCAMCMSRSQTCSNMPYVPFWWERIWKDPAFVAETGCRWKTLRRGPLELAALKARVAVWEKHLAPLAIPRHFMRWPELVPPASAANVPAFFKQEVASLLQWTEARMAWLDRNLTGSCP